MRSSEDPFLPDPIPGSALRGGSRSIRNPYRRGVNSDLPPSDLRLHGGFARVARMTELHPDICPQSETALLSGVAGRPPCRIRFARPRTKEAHRMDYVR